MRYAKLAAVTLLLAACWIESAGAGPEFGDFVVEGAAVGATQVEVGVFDLHGKQIDSAVFPVEDNGFRGALPLPIGTEVELHVRALDRRGNPLATGESRVRFADMKRGAEQLQLMTEGREVIGAFLTSPIRLEVTSERIDEERTRFFLHGFDAHDERIEIDAGQVSWSIPFPLPGDWLPCKPSGVDPIPCIEVRIPLRQRPEIVACHVDLMCKGGSGATTTGYLAISAGTNHTCALTTQDKIVCWGSNDLGQLGTASAPQICQSPPSLANFRVPCSTRPREIECPSGHPCRWIALDAGNNHTCAIDINKNIYCWGANYWAQSGCPSCGWRSTGLQRVTPPTILGDMPVRFRKVSAGTGHSCGISERGNAICWGSNAFSKSGGPATSFNLPRHVVGQKPFMRIAAGLDHTCATTSVGELECWGGNRKGEIRQPADPWAGFPDPLNVRPFHSTSLVGAVDLVATGAYATCAHSAAGGVACWGIGSAADTQVHASADTDLELGFVAPSSPSNPVPLVDVMCDIRLGDVHCGLTSQPLQKIAGLPTQAYDTTVGGWHYCSVHADGRAFCWGSNNEVGQMGDGTQVAHSIPVQVIAP
jgi:alpha-tubulin suppressor-like RCC1 family protein